MIDNVLEIRNFVDKNDDFYQQKVERKIKETFYDNTYYEKYPSARGEISLFRAVIMQAITDCYTLSKRTEDANARYDAVEWFKLDNYDFLKICRYADMDPEFVLSKAKDSISNGCIWRKNCPKEKKLKEMDRDIFDAKVISLNPELFKKRVSNM
jgi:hypothetical protein